MTEKEKAQTLKWIECWRNAASELEQARRDRIENADTQSAIGLLQDAYQSAVSERRPRDTSGLVEQQKYFSKARS